MSEKGKKVGLALTSSIAFSLLIVLVVYLMLIINEFEPLFGHSSSNSTGPTNIKSTVPASLVTSNVPAMISTTASNKADLSTSSMATTMQTTVSVKLFHSTQNSTTHLADPETTEQATESTESFQSTEAPSTIERVKDPETSTKHQTSASTSTTTTIAPTTTTFTTITTTTASSTTTVTTTPTSITTCYKTDNSSCSELLGQFKITKNWDELLADPQSEEFMLLAEQIKIGLVGMLSQDEDLAERAYVNVIILGFRFVKLMFSEKV